MCRIGRNILDIGIMVAINNMLHNVLTDVQKKVYSNLHYRNRYRNLDTGFESKSEDNSTGSNPIKVEKCKEKIILFSPELWFTVS
jgi:hypothetical protein